MSLLSHSCASGRTDAAPIAVGNGDVRDYFELLKPRVMSLVIFTALVGIVRAGGDLHPVLAFTALLCIAVGAGAAGALNMWWDADIDAEMSRTRNRPIPAGRVAPSEALAFGLVLAVGSVLTLGLFNGLLAAALLAFTIFFYAVIYSMWLKRWTPQNIVIGGAAGAFPPVIGWAAATGAVSLESILLFLIVFFWTPPHFWALALVRRKDYARVGVPMLPVVAGETETRRQIVIYSVILAVLGVSPAFLGYAGIVYGAVSAVLGIAFVALSLDVWRRREGTVADRTALRLFTFSILHLFLLFAVLLIEPFFG